MVYRSINAALEGVQFPINKSSLIREVGDREVEVLEGKTMSMREILNACPHDMYESEADVIKCPEIVDKVRHAA
ncbi:MAG: hypothetical protein QME63_00505 [Actinomycetota bacterium]|nr:hypothetical protein [Actinomycetota bacterium]